MTIGEALMACVPYPLNASNVELICLKRGINPADTLVDARQREYRLCEADVKMFVVSYPSSISEGGVSISKGELESLQEEANTTYLELGESEKSTKPKVMWYQI